ncbi:hypothetical protein LZ31DRAFT_579223 [Colletotrichum somersetense]|nr:hypothetical protein LZ31DRAFT_579223 [Colletotrichum somersetense]
MDDFSPYGKFIQQYQPPVATGMPPHQSDNSTGYQHNAIHDQPRPNIGVTKCKNENQFDHSYEPHGNSMSARSGHAGSNIHFQPAFDAGGHAQSYPYPQQNHHSNSFNASGDYTGEQKNLRHIADGEPNQGYVRMSPHAVQAGAVHPRQMTGTSNGSHLRDAGYRRNKPPFKGKVEIRKEEAALNEVTTIQSLEGNRFHEDNVCNQCGHFGHWLGDCVFPDDSGYIKGCPVHNTKDHTWDDCPDARKMSQERKIMYLILRRRNKPAIQSNRP